MATIDSLLRLIAAQAAEALVLRTARPPELLKAGVARPLSMPPMPPDMLQTLLGEVLAPGQLAALRQTGDLRAQYVARDVGSFEVRCRTEGAGLAATFRPGRGGARPVETDLPPAVVSAVAAVVPPEAPVPVPVRSPGGRETALTPRGSLGDLLAGLVRDDVSDVLVVAGQPLTVRRPGGLERLDTVAPGEAELLALCAPALEERDRRSLAEGGSVDLALGLGSGPAVRFRVNLFRHAGGLSAALRPIRDRVPGLADLGLPASIAALGELPFGLVLFTGPTGSGKSTTLAALIEHLNQTVSRHVITLEDPIEYVYPPGRCLIHQRELHAHVPTFAEGLRAALREAPDVILVGEMRDPETIAAALTAAETGHLVLSTLHCGTAALAVDRIVDGFPEHRRLQVRAQLADVLRTVVSQRLLPTARGDGRVPAVEVLQVTPAVASVIREGRGHQLQSLIQTGREHGMMPLERALAALVRAGKVTPAAALVAAPDRKALADLIGG